MQLDNDDFAFIKQSEEFYYSPDGESFDYSQILSRYKKIRKIGQGGFGTVYHCVNRTTGKEVAIKFMGIGNQLKADQVKEIFRESRTMRLLNHSNIVKLHFAFLHKKDIVLIMEYAGGGELRSFIREHPEGCSELHT